jgi:hypothetical protein
LPITCEALGSITVLQKKREDEGSGESHVEKLKGTLESCFAEGEDMEAVTWTGHQGVTSASELCSLGVCAFLAVLLASPRL